MDDLNVRSVHRSTIVGLFGLATLACGGVPPPLLPPTAVDEAPLAERYSIQTDRLRHVGQRWRVRVVRRNSVSQDIGDAPRRFAEVLIELAAVAQLIEVDPAGRQLRLEYTVESFRSGDTREPLVSPGSVITVIRAPSRCCESMARW